MKLNPRDRKLVIFIGAVALLAAGYWFLFIPLSERWTKVNQELAKKETEIKEAQRALRMEKKLERDYFEAQTRLEFAKGRLPKEEGIPKLLKDVYYKMGKESGVVILSFSEGALQPKEFYKIKPISLSLKCDLPSLVKFLYQIKKSGRLLDVLNMNISSQAEGKLSVNLRLATFVYSE